MKSQLHYSCLLLFLLIISSCQDINSHSFDENLYGDNRAQGSAAFVAAFSVIESECINCHSGWHNSYSSLLTEQSWIDASLIIPGDAVNSDIIKRLRNYGSIGGMPIEGPITNDQYETLRDWINGI